MHETKAGNEEREARPILRCNLDYTVSLRLKAKFLTGVDTFKNLDNVEFLK